MSRSFKKTPGWCDYQPWAKKQANRRVRQYKGGLPDGGAYKKLFEQWTICDWKFLYFTERDLQELENDPWDPSVQGDSEVDRVE